MLPETFKHIPKQHRDLVFYPMKPGPCLVMPYTVNSWYMEPKYDGWHTLFVSDGHFISAYSRNLKRNMYDWLALQPIFKKLKELKYRKKFVMLCELVAESGIRTDVPKLKKGGVAHPKFFDIICEETGDKPLYQRRQFLENIELPIEWLVEHQLIESVDNLKKHFSIYTNTKGMEGVVIKDPISYYEQSRKIGVVTHQWLKIK